MAEDFVDRGVKKYRVETDWDKQLNVLNSRLPGARLRGCLRAEELQALIARVKAILARFGVWAEYYAAYISYAEALYKSQLRLNWMVDRVREHRILRDKWESRGLDPVILDEIDRILIFNKTNP